MKGRILTSLLTVIALTGLQAQNIPAVPRLVVGLTIDQLRTDYIEAFSALYGERGFKRLWREGRIYRNAEYDFINVDKSSAVAAIYSGTTPYTNGIVGDNWMDRSTLRVLNCVDDADFMGIYTSESTSPQKMKVSTLTDELVIATQGIAEVYSIAPTREMAVLAAGHASKGAFWLNDETGKWSGSTYYGTFPAWVTTYNDREGLDFRIGNMSWEPYLPVTVYKYLTSENKQVTFKHNFDDERKNKYRKLKTSPYANDEVNRLVNACFSNTSIGKDAVPDFLSLAYYAGNYDHKAPAELPMEMQDTYVRLDNSIAELLELAIYGEGQWVEAHFEQQIYLNHKLIEQKQLNISEILNRAAEFLVQFSGVKDVYSSQRLQLGAWTPTIDKIKNYYNPICSGDLWIEVLPGWTVFREHSLDTQVQRYSYASAPLIFIGNGMKPEIIHAPIKIGNIAPTVAHYMRIRAPNAAVLAPMTDIRK